MTKRTKITNALITIENIINNTDPISHGSIRYKYGLCRHGVLIYFDAKVLHDYIEDTGDMKDPITRMEYEHHELVRLDRVSRKKTNIASRIEELKKMYLNELQRCYTRDNLMEELTSLFNNIYETVQIMDNENLLDYIDSIFVPIFFQIRENLILISYSSELDILRRFILSKHKEQKLSNQIRDLLYIIIEEL
jgi:hypothetical protein